MTLKFAHEIPTLYRILPSHILQAKVPIKFKAMVEFCYDGVTVAGYLNFKLGAEELSARPMLNKQHISFLFFASPLLSGFL